MNRNTATDAVRHATRFGRLSGVAAEILRPTFSPLERTQRTVLAALSGGAKHVYGGTVPPKTKARRRAANKAARVARRASR